MAEVDSALASSSESKAISLVVKDQLGHEVHFKIKNTTKMDKVRAGALGTGLSICTWREGQPQVK